MNRRLLLLALLVVGVVVLAYLFLGRSSKAAKVTSAPVTAAPSAAVTPMRSAAVTAGTTASTTPGGTAVTTAAATPRVTAGRTSAVYVSAQNRQLRAYAAALVPIVTRGLRTFDSVAGNAAASTNLGDLSSLCTNSLKSLGLAQSQVEGVPHAQPWYTPVGQLHRELLGIYHTMVGAADSCGTSAGNGQESNADTSVSYMVHADRSLHSLLKHIEALAKLPH